MVWWQYLITGLLILFVIAAGIGTLIYFLVIKPSPTPPTPPTPPHPPDCKNPIKTVCDPVKFCMRYECNGKIVECTKDDSCIPKYVISLNKIGYLTNGSTGMFVLSETFINFKNTNVTAAVMAQIAAPSMNYVVTPVSYTGNQFIFQAYGDTYTLSKGDVSNPLINFVISTDKTAAKWYYNELTGQIVDDLENPASQLSVTTSTLPTGTFQQLFSIPYNTNYTNKEIWFLTPN